MAIVVR